ncbi:hypothetical protein [Actinotignum sanguinis]|uniref:hypothetical protein n=1 Tax=Actinotignum sanguinis TaxID=1445614 RepID=UPI0029345F7C|nr:hypothetical protein [Actinotignum sanguinis]MDV2436503.1 hypothetical protein [Actinotignum sanguinis]
MPSYSYPGDGLLACVPGLAVFTPALPADPAAVWETVRAGHDFPTLLTHLWSALGADFALFYADGPLLRVAAHGLIIRDVTGRAVADGSNALTWQEAATTQDTTVTVGNAYAAGAENAAFGGNDAAAPAPGPALPLERGMARAGGARISLSPVLTGRPATPALAVPASSPATPAPHQAPHPAPHPVPPAPPLPPVPPAAQAAEAGQVAQAAESAPVPSYAAATEAYPVQTTEPYPFLRHTGPAPGGRIAFLLRGERCAGRGEPGAQKYYYGAPSAPRCLLRGRGSGCHPTPSGSLPTPRNFAHPLRGCGSGWRSIPAGLPFQ